MDLPPREVPQGLTAPQYLRLAQEYKKMGWIEQARDASTLAIELADDSQVAQEAKRFLKTKVPRFPVPLLAEQRFIEGFNQLVAGDTAAAMQTFQDLVKDYPDFEWAYGQLSLLYLQEGQNLEAIELLKIALKINPDYVNGWLHLATAHGLELDFRSAKKCVERALLCDPSDQTAKSLKEELDKLDR